MSEERINLAELRDFLAAGGMGEYRRIRLTDALALMEAVEMAKALRDVEAHMPLNTPGAHEWSDLDAALSRFEFEPVRE